LKAESALQRNKRRGTKAQLVDAMNGLVPTIQDTVEEVRRICTGLRPSLLDDLGLVTTIGWCCREFQAHCPDIAIEQAIGIREYEIPESLKIVIFRIVQEALNNAAKYSRADRVTLSLVKDDGAVALALTDDGVGFDLDRVAIADSRVRGLGISGMRERTGDPNPGPVGNVGVSIRLGLKPRAQSFKTG
jgi:signal transduction histidine kinase